MCLSLVARESYLQDSDLGRNTVRGYNSVLDSSFCRGYWHNLIHWAKYTFKDKMQKMEKTGGKLAAGSSMGICMFLFRVGNLLAKLSLSKESEGW